MKRLVWLWGPPVLLAAAIFYLSSQALPAVVAPPQGFDKLAHFGVYALLGGLLARAFRGAGTRWPLLWATLTTAAYGVSDELHQSFVPERSVELLDALADAAGGLVGAWLALAVAGWWERRRRSHEATPPA